jgi:hypothetical protein
MKLIMLVTGAGASGSVALAGLDRFGNAQSETVTMSGNGTYYSSLIYSAINASGVTVTGLTSGSIAITGVYAWNRSFLPAINPFTQALEWFTGSASFTAPFVAYSDFEFAFDVKKDFTLKATGIAQDMLPIGDRTTVGLTTSRVNPLAQPTDKPNAAWACNVYIDPISGTAGTTQFGDMQSGSLKVSNPLEGVHTLTNRQVYQQVSRGKWSAMLDAVLVFTSLLQMEQFRQDNKQWVQLVFGARSVGGGNIQQIIFVLPFKFTKFEPTSNPTDKYPTVAISGIAEYEPAIGASYKVQWQNSVQPPSYTS